MHRIRAIHLKETRETVFFWTREGLDTIEKIANNTKKKESIPWINYVNSFQTKSRIKIQAKADSIRERENSKKGKQFNEDDKKALVLLVDGQMSSMLSTYSEMSTTDRAKYAMNNYNIIDWEKTGNPLGKISINV